MSLNSESVSTKIPSDTTDYIEMLKHTSQKWRMEFKKLSHELFNKEQNKNKVYDTEVEKLFDDNRKPFVDGQTQTYDKDFEEIESLLKVIESKQQQLKQLNETLLETVTENVDEIWKSINLSED